MLQRQAVHERHPDAPVPVSRDDPAHRLTGEYLFQPKEHGNVSRDLEQLALFEEVLGPIPAAFARSGRRAREFLDKDVGERRSAEA